MKRPGFLHWTGNLALSAPNIRLENGEEIWFTDALIIWPLSGGGTEQGVILYEYELHQDGADCISRQLYITPEGDYIPWGDEAEDRVNAATGSTRRCWRTTGILWRRCWTGRRRCGASLK